jgi:hypothetical protein
MTDSGLLDKEASRTNTNKQHSKSGKFVHSEDSQHVVGNLSKRPEIDGLKNLS